MTRRKGTPCACESDPCGCGSSKGKCIRAINNVSPDPNGDLEVIAGNGIAFSQSGDNQITVINDATASSFVAGDNIEINPSGDDLEIRLTDNPVINGTLQVNGDIIQQGAAYETHAEKVYTTNDYIYMRDGAVGGLAIGSLSGFEVIKYDGTNNGRLAIDKDGSARVGDVGDEQPLLTRDEAANLTNGALLKWDANNYKAVNEGSVGSDTKPVKIVNGVAVAVTNTLATELYASNPNQLVNNVNDWLTVDINNKDANANRTTILNHAVTTNAPHQSGDSVYCYFGTRFVFWQANGFVTVFVVGQGNDSNAHIWIDNYNNNTGDWSGWKRVF